MTLRQTCGRIGWRLAQAMLTLTLAASLYATQPEMPAKSAVGSSPIKSEFRNDPKFGKDPFFPNSPRRQVTNETSTAAEALVPITKLKLQGISGPKEKRLAIINNRTFEVGEEAEIKVESRLLKIRCVEIREHSVMATINGQTQELVLGQRF